MDDLCGWEAVPADGTEWGQWPGAGPEPGVGPEDDFSRPGFGSYMLLDSLDPTRPGSSLLRSPLYQSPGGCLALSFYYTLHGVSHDTALNVFAATPGGGLGPPLLSLTGEHGPSWLLSSVNYSGTADVQFVLQGLYRGQPGLAVDSVRISPCEEVFAQCDFNNAKDPFCGWVQPSNASWEWTNQTTPTEETGPPGDYPHGEGHYIYVEGGSLQPGQSLRLTSRDFCSSAGACVEFRYYMHGIVAVQTQLRVLVEGPSGGAVPLWTRTGVQSKAWLFGAVTVPYGEPQPSRVVFEVIRGSNPYLDVALDNISVRRGPCAAGPGTPAPTAGSSAATSTEPAVTVWPGGSTATSPTTTSHKVTTTHSRPTTAGHQTSGMPRPTPNTSTAPSQGVSTSTGHEVPNTSTQSAHTTVSSATTSGQTPSPTASNTSPATTSHEVTTTHTRPTTAGHQTSGVPRPTPTTSTAPSQGVSTSTGHVVPNTSTQSAPTTVSSATTSGQTTTGPTASSQEKPTSTSQTGSAKTTTSAVVKTSTPSPTASNTSPATASHEVTTTHSRPTTAGHQTSGVPRPTPAVSAPSQGVSTSTDHVVPNTSTQSAHTTVSSATTSGQTPSPTASNTSPATASHEVTMTHSGPTTAGHQTSGVPRPTLTTSTAPSQGVSTSTGHVVPNTSSPNPTTFTQSAQTSSAKTTTPAVVRTSAPSTTASHASPAATSTVSTSASASVGLPSTTASHIPSSLPSSTAAHTGPNPTSSITPHPGPATGTTTSQATPLATSTAGHTPPPTATISAAPPTSSTTAVPGSPPTPGSHSTPATAAPTSPSGPTMAASSPTTGRPSTATTSQQTSTTPSPARPTTTSPTTTRSYPDPSSAPQSSQTTSGHSRPVTVPRTTGQTSPATAPSLSTSPGYTRPSSSSLTTTSPAKPTSPPDSPGPTSSTAHVSTTGLLSPTPGQASTADSASATATSPGGLPTSRPAGTANPATLPPTSPTPASPGSSQAGPSTASHTRPTSGPTSAAGTTTLATSTLATSHTNSTARPPAGPTTTTPTTGHASTIASSPGSSTAAVVPSTPAVASTTVARPTTTTPRPSASTTKSPVPAPDRETCVVSGDPHYATYDGRRFDFMGTCTYLLSAVCDAAPGLPAFRVEAANEHRGANTQVSYVKAVRVEVLATRIVLLKARRVTVDGRRVSLPVSVAGGRVSVRLSGTFALVQTDFGLWVRFDGNHHAEVSAPSSYAGRLCGLCGNYNGQLSDDNLMPNGTSAGADADRLGESWQVPDEGDTGCTNAGGPGECDQEIATEAQKPTSCGILTDPQGPFAACHGHLPPEGALQNCIYDLCGTGGEAGSLCFSLQSYADRCAQAGVPVVWRNSSFCPLNCPAGSSYTPCGPACPATCTDRTANDSCPGLPCVEGCVCLEDHLLSGDGCVPVSQCGCTDSAGQYHPVGDSWMGNSNCTERCFCGGPNNITCREWSCSPVQRCQLQEGLLDCQDLGVAACHVAGDPHYFTFDSTMVSFMGTCTYTLVTTCLSDPDLPSFTITGKNEERGQPEASYLRQVTVQVAGATVTLQKGRRVLIDGQRVRTPIEGVIPGVSITTSGIYVVLETNFGLVVKFDGNHHLEIQLPGTYFGKVCGMCGNFNNDSRDELLMPDGHLAANASQFGNSWKAPGDSDPGCQPDNREDLEPSCPPQQMEHLNSLCSEILAPKYQPCHPLVDPQPFLQNCLYDMCEYQGMLSVLCDNIQAYVEACKSQGVTSLSWRNSTFCPLPCPPHSHYSECTSPCPATCANLYAPASCQRPTTCVEGCACDRGYVLSDDSCVPMRDCGCLDKGHEYHRPGDSWVTPGCAERCACLGNGSVSCRPFQCLPGSQCALSATGLRYCRPTKFHQCVVSGDPHYRTFDSFAHHFQGRATYTLTRTLAGLPAVLEPLSVSGRNLRRLPFHRVSFLREVFVSVYGYRVTLMQGRKLAVNGVRVTPPYAPRDGLQITQRGRSLFLQTDFGLSVSFDGRDFAEIVLPSTYQTHVGGLCGNYDGRRNNEYMKPDGTWTRSLNAFGSSWQVSAQGAALEGRTAEAGGRPRARREDPAEEEESGFELGCSQEQLTYVNGTEACGALSDPQGPFAACHSVVPPDTFQESCVYDLCALPGDAQLRCQDYEAYAQVCQEEAVTLGPWRARTGCEISCPAHTTYQPCMTACPASCANMAAPSDCDAPCVEGCASDAGYVLSGLDSVPYRQCGCSRHGQYYQINDTFWTEDCAQLCTCRNTDTLECLGARCPDAQICTVANYTRGCFTVSACLSSPCQNEGVCEEVAEPAGGFLCRCLEGYAGTLCEETPQDAPAPSSGHLTAILLGVLLPLGVILTLVTVVLVCLRRKKRKSRKDDYAVFLVPGQEKVPDTLGQKITPF